MTIEFATKKDKVKSYRRRDGSVVRSFFRKREKPSPPKKKVLTKKNLAKAALALTTGTTVALGARQIINQRNQINDLSNQVNNLGLDLKKREVELEGARNELHSEGKYLESLENANKSLKRKFLQLGQQQKQTSAERLEALGRLSTTEKELDSTKTTLGETQKALEDTTRKISSREKALGKYRTGVRKRDKELGTVKSALTLEQKRNARLSQTAKSKTEEAAKAKSLATGLQTQYNETLKRERGKQVDLEIELDRAKKLLKEGERPFKKELDELRTTLEQRTQELDKANTNMERQALEVGYLRKSTGARLDVKKLEDTLREKSREVNRQKTLRRLGRLGSESPLKQTKFQDELMGLNKQIQKLRSKKDPESQAKYIELVNEKRKLADKIRGRVSKLGGGNATRSRSSSKAKNIRVGQFVVDPSKRKRDYDYSAMRELIFFNSLPDSYHLCSFFSRGGRLKNIENL